MSCILDNTIHGRIDQVKQILELDQVLQDSARYEPVLQDSPRYQSCRTVPGARYKPVLRDSARYEPVLQDSAWYKVGAQDLSLDYYTSLWDLDAS